MAQDGIIAGRVLKGGFELPGRPHQADRGHRRLLRLHPIGAGLVYSHVVDRAVPGGRGRGTGVVRGGLAERGIGDVVGFFGQRVFRPAGMGGGGAAEEEGAEGEEPADEVSQENRSSVHGSAWLW